MNSILLLEAVAREFREMETTLREAMGDAIDGHSLPEAVALLVSQRENARNAHAAHLEADSKSKYRLLWNHGESACGFDSVEDVREFISETLPTQERDGEEVI